MVLTVTAASDCFAQDIEPDPDGQATPTVDPPKKRAEPQEKSGGDKSISEPQRKRFFAKCRSANLEDSVVKAYMLEHYDIESSNEIQWGKMYNELCDWADAQAK